MKKTFQLEIENLNPDRVLEGIKKEIRKYIKREKKKKLPEDMDMWTMNCKFAIGDATPKPIGFIDIMKNVDAAANSESNTFYLEILTSAVKRTPKKRDSE